MAGLGALLRKVCNPENYTKTQLLGILCIFVVISFYLHRSKYRLAFSRNLWGMFSVLCCSFLVTGPQGSVQELYAYTSLGRELIYRHHNMQYTGEAYIMSALYATVTLGIILIIEAAGGVDSSGFRRPVRRLHRYQAFVGVAAVCGIFSLCIGIFRYKRPWYPYYFLITQH